jgi:outer membrane receptor protein involved in Fe transport
MQRIADAVTWRGALGTRALIAAASAMLAGTAVASDARSAAGNAELDEIIVTAQRRNENLQDVPIAISVATEEQLRREQVYSMTDMQRITPGLEVSQTFGGENTGGGRIRGVGTAVTSAGATASVALVVDQVPQGNVAFTQFFDLAQVEVLRGPQGTLFGQTASAGVINMTTAAPNPSAFSARVGLDYSNKGSLGSEFGQRVFNGAVNIPLSGTSALRIATLQKEEVGVQRNVYLGDDSRLRDSLFRVRYLIAPTEAFKVNLIAEYNKEHKHGDYFFNPAIAPTNPANLAIYTNCGLRNIDQSAQDYCDNGMGKVDFTNLGLSAIVDWNLGGVTLTSVTGYRAKDKKVGYTNFIRHVGLAQSNSQRQEDKNHQISEELRVSSTGDGPLGYTAGLFYSDYSFNSSPLDGAPVGSLTAPVGFSLCVNPVTGPCNFIPGTSPVFTDNFTTITSKAVFADLTYAANDAWSVFGGARYTNQKSGAVIGRLQNRPADFYQSLTITDNNVSGRLGVRWKQSKNAMWYLTASRGFKGSTPIAPSNNTTPIQPLNAEISTSYELGAKLTFLEDKLILNANAFDTVVKNFQVQTNQLINAVLTAVPKNVSELASKGVEFDLLARPVASLRLNAGYLFDEAKYPSGFLGEDGKDLGGLQFANAPRHKFTLSGEYSHSLSAALEGFFTLSGVYKSGVRLANRTTDLYVYPGHTTLNASIGLRSMDGKWTASLFARNFTRQREPTAYIADAFGTTVDGVRAWNDGGLTLRQVGITASYDFH